MLREQRARTIALWRRLAAYGFVDGLDVIARHGPDTIDAALEWLHAQTGMPTNPGGLLRRYLAQLLITGQEPPLPERTASQALQDERADATRRRENNRYISGRYGHLVQR